MNKFLLDNKFIQFLAAFFACWSTQLSLGITVRNPLTVVLFVVFFMCLNRISCFSYKGDRKVLLMVLLGALSVALAVLLTYLNYRSASENFSSSFFRLITLLVLVCGFVFLFAGFFKGIFFLIYRDKCFEKNMEAERKSDRKLLDTALEKRIFLLTFAICIICFIPYFLYEFPGIMTADSLVQYDQIIGRDVLSNHHPIIHTATIALFYRLGMLVTSEPTFAISFYTIAQMLFLSFAAAVCVREVFRILGFFSVRLYVLLAAFFALLPFNAVFAVTIWKDVPFAAVSVLLCCQLSGMIRQKKTGLHLLDFVIFSVLSIMFALYRSNALYAFVVFVPFFLYFFRDRIKAASITAAVIILLVVLIKGPVFNAFGVIGPDFTESLSLPIQQVARVIVEGGNIDDRDRALIEDCIDISYVQELYAPDFADNMKELVRAGSPKVLSDKKMEYLALYLRLGIRNPGSYIRAFCDLEGGYLYPDVAYKVADMDGIMTNSVGLYSSPIIGGKFIKVKEILLKLSDFMPLYGMFFCIGAYTWGLLICLFVSLRRKEAVLVHLLFLFLLLTLLIAAPLVSFRYAYAMILSMPVWAALSLTKELDRIFS